MNCDPIARAYRYLEYASFGTALHRRRCHFLPELHDARKVLILGEGDGRFLAEFARANPEAQVDYIDRSAKMLELAKHRSGRSAVRFHLDNLLDSDVPGTRYDTVVTHFFLDCFSEEDVTTIVEKIARCVVPDARWVVSEFREPAAGWRKWRARFWIRGLYLTFRMATGLRAQRLPNYPAALCAAGFRLQAETITSAGLLTSQLWKRDSFPTT